MGENQISPSSARKRLPLVLAENLLKFEYPFHEKVLTPTNRAYR